MAEVNLTRDRREGDFTISGDASLQLVFQVLADSDDLHPDEVIAISGLPRFADSHPTQYGAYVVGLKASQQPGKRSLWEVTVSYETTADGEPPEFTPREISPPSNPELAPPELTFNTVRREWAVDKEKDANGTYTKPVLNVIGRPYDPPLMLWKPNGQVRVARNELRFDNSSWDKYVGKVNSTFFAGGVPGTVMCTDVSSAVIPYGTTFYWRVNYIFEFSEDGWQPEVFQADVYQKSYNYVSGQTTMPITRLRDDHGSYITVPQPLDENGFVVPEENRPAGYYFKQHEPLKEIDFNQIGLPL